VSSLQPARAVFCLLAALVVERGLVGAAAPPVADVPGIARVGGRPQPGVVVWLDEVAGPAPSRPRRVVLDQRNLTFLPHVLAVPVGTRVEMPNNDRVFHNVFSFKDGKRFDLGLYPVGTSKVVDFDKPGLSRIFCNIHPTMGAYVIAVPSAHLAVSGEDGRFVLSGVPPGRYPYHAWRPGAETVQGKMEVVAGRMFEVDWP
jgi:plastocyanin